jgi:mRNA-degrading endonuclease toxin of MazEF toxin-antitoxin module
VGEEKCAPSPQTPLCLSQWAILKMSLTKVGCTLKDSVANVSQVITLDQTFLTERIGSLPDYLQEEVDEGLRTVLYL